MKIFQTQMGKSKSLPKAKLYPWLLALCDEQIADLSTQVTMLANLDTACRLDAQGKGRNDGGSGGSGSGAANGGGWKSKGRPGAHTTNQDGRGSGGGDGGAVRKGGDGIANQSSSPKKCVFCSGFHPFIFYCEYFIKARLKDRFLTVLKQKSCSRCLTMGRTFDSKCDVWWPDHEPYCKIMFICEEGTCQNAPKDKQRHLVMCSAHYKQNTALIPEFIKKTSCKSIAQGMFLQNLRYFHAQTYHSIGGPVTVAPLMKDHLGFKLLPDVRDEPVFMLQTVPSEDPSCPLLVFYSSIVQLICSLHSKTGNLL